MSTSVRAVSTPTSTAPPGAPRRRVRRLRWLAVVVLAVLAAWWLARGFVTLATNILWFRSVGEGSVYGRELTTQVLLFVVVGLLTAGAVAATLVVAIRSRPRSFLPHPTKQRSRALYARVLHPYRWWLVALVAVLLGWSAGSRAAAGWQTWLMWRNAVPFHVSDPQFHRDVSYYLFVYPLHRFVVTTLFRIVVTCLVAALVAGWLYGAVRLRGPRPRTTRALRAQVSLLVGLLLLLKAVAYWLDRYGLATSNRGVVTGPSYTDVHVMSPDKLVLVVIAVVAAIVVLANVALGSTRLLVLGVGGMAIAALVLGIAVPALVQQFRVKPSAASVELPYIARNIAATRQAFGLARDVTTTPYPGVQQGTGRQLRRQLNSSTQVRLLDPNRLSPTFTQLQQQKSFYGFKNTLDIDRYPIGPSGQERDVVIALRELQLSGLQSSQRTWANQHLVYTHGYGVVAAPTDRVDAKGEPAFVERDLPSTGVLGTFEQRVYYGQMSPSYSIVGGPTGSPDREFDRPGSNGVGQVTTTHTGAGGVPIGSTFRRLLYAAKLNSTSILFSSQINAESQLLTVRNPRSRVAAVAPWLTLDGAVYPVVADGRILWVVDGYTTSNSYPYSQQQNLRASTATSLTTSNAVVTQPNRSVNYMRNSVVATVDAYSGAVRLYEWDQGGALRDPVLQTWEHAFPGLVRPQTAIPTALVPHLRYPQDLFNVQRSVLTQYHVTSPTEFYSGSDFWKVPTDPTLSATTSKNALGGTVVNAPPAQPSTYMTMSQDGSSPGAFALSTPLVTLNRRSLAGYLSVDSTPGPRYGSFRLLQMPTNQAVEGPAQVQNDIESNPVVAQQLTLLRGGGSKVVLGNQLAIPLGGQLLYVEPVYEQAAGGTSFPILRRVVAEYAGGEPSFESTLPAAVNGALGITTASTSSGAGPSNAALQSALAAARQAQAAIAADVGAGDLKAYARDEQALQKALDQISAASGNSTATP